MPENTVVTYQYYTVGSTEFTAVDVVIGSRRFTNSDLGDDSANTWENQKEEFTFPLSEAELLTIYENHPDYKEIIHNPS